MNVKTPINIDEFVSSLGVIEFFRKFAENLRCLPNAESLYWVTDKELLGILCVIKKCEYHLANHNCIIYTDHKLLLHL